MKAVLEEIRKIESEGGWKSRLFRLGYALIAFEFITGCFLWVTHSWNSAGMMLLLGHIILGFLMIVPAALFSLKHSAYRKSLKDAAFDALGVFTAGGLFIALLSGVYLTFSGVTGHAVIWWGHVAISVLASVGSVLYIAWILKEVLALLKGKTRESFLKLVGKTVVAVLALSGLGIGIFVIAGAAYRDGEWRPSVASDSVLQGRPTRFSPGHLSTVDGGLVNKARFTRSESCGTSGCHVDIVRQWKDSAHFRTPNYFVKKVTGLLFKEAGEGYVFHEGLLIRKPGALAPKRETLRECASCHAPVALLTGNIAEKRLLGPGMTPEKLMGHYGDFEGDSCVLCHSIAKGGSPEDFRKGQPRILVASQPRYLFWEAESPVKRWIYKTLVNAKPIFHAKAFSRPDYKTAEYCADCHLARQYQSWVIGPYSYNGPLSKRKVCQDCHMPQTEAPNDVSGKVKGTVADHRFLAEGFGLARAYHRETQFDLSRTFLRDKKLTIAILAPKKISGKDAFKFALRISNVGIGHAFPAGPAGDLAETWAEVVIRAGNGKVIYRYGFPDRNGYLNDKKTRIYRIIMLDAKKRPLGFDRHRGWRYESEILDNIAPLQYDDIPMEAALPTHSGQGQIRIETRLLYRRPNQRFADWVFGKGKFVAPVMEIARASASIDLDSDPSSLDAARKAWLRELATPPVVDGLPLGKKPDIRPILKKMKIPF